MNAKIFFLCLITVVFCKETTNSVKSIKLNYLPENQFFTYPLSVGSPAQVFEVQIDTTTSETWVPSFNTSYNVTPKYNALLSSTSNTTNKTVEINDEEGDVIGKATYDDIKFGEFSLKQFGFAQVLNYEVETFTDYPKGKLGVGFNHERGDNFNFIKSLKNNGLIEKEMFTIIPKSHEIVIGSLPVEAENITTCKIAPTEDLDDDYRQGWVCELTHVFLSDNDIESSIDDAHDVPARVIFDSAYHFISVPKVHFELFNKSFIVPLFNNSCHIERAHHEKYFVCDASEETLNKASISFVIGGYAYTLKQDSLFEKNEAGQYELLIRFKEEHDDIWAFGFPFLDNYNVIFDYENKTVGFYAGETIDMYEDWMTWMNGESPKQKKEKMKMLITGACILGTVLLLLVICLICRACKKNKIAEHGPLMQNEEVKQ